MSTLCPQYASGTAESPITSLSPSRPRMTTPNKEPNPSWLASTHTSNGRFHALNLCWF